MRFLEDLGATISMKSNEVTGKAKDAIEINGLNSRIQTLGKEVKENYAILGEIYFNTHKGDEECENKEVISTIAGLLGQIESLNQEIEDIRRRQAETAALSQQYTARNNSHSNGVVFCTNCGAKLSSDDVFCTECGTKVE